MSAKVQKIPVGTAILLRIFRAPGAAAIGLVLALTVSTVVNAATITVNSVADTEASGPDICILRDAITAANTQAAQNGCAAGTGNDTIQFSVTGTILLGGNLPTITDKQLTIKGSSAPGIVIDGQSNAQIMQIAPGAALNLANLTITHGFNFGLGGGVLNAGTLTITNSIFSRNVAFFEGGGFGGGIFNESGATLTVTNSAFTGNGADEGGGISSFGAATITNSTFSSNRASTGGGVNNDGTLIVTNSTFSGNRASSTSAAGGIFNQASAGLVTLKNTIIAGSTTGGGGPSLNCSGTITDGGYNLSDDSSCGFSATGSHNATDPELDPAGLSNNGRPTKTIALLARSPANDAIPLASCTDQTGKRLTSDQRGFSRPDSPESTCDIGAYEFEDAAATIVVNSLSDPSVAGLCTLHDAILAAETKTAINGCAAGNDFSTIQFSVAGTIRLAGTLPTITNTQLTINGPGAPGIIIDGRSEVQIMNVDHGATLNLTNLTISDGFGGRYPGVGFNFGNLTISNSTVSGNGFAEFGGALANGGVLVITNSTFSGNEAVVGGGAIDNFEFATLSITNSTFSNNSAGANPGGGGAISNSTEGALTVTNSTFSGNSSFNGGAIQNFGTMSITNSTFSGNSGVFRGGTAGISNDGTVILKNTVVAGSTTSGGSRGLNCSGTITDGGFNLSDDNSCGLTANGSSNNTNPGLSSAGLADNGGPTETIALVLGSPAIDAIPLASCTDQAGNRLTTDQRGFPRPDVVNKVEENVCDIGAYEFQDPTRTPTPTPTATPTPIAGAVVIPPASAVNSSGGPGATVNSGSFTVQNNSGTGLLTPVVTISFDNADLFSSATLSTTIGSTTSTATVNPVAGGNSPEQPNSTNFVLEPPPVIPAGQSAIYSLTVTVSSNPQVSRGSQPVMYAAMAGGGSTGFNGLLVGLLLLELSAAVIGTTKRKQALMLQALMLLALLLVLAHQAACDNGSSHAGTPTGTVQSTQTATSVEAEKENNDPPMITGLPVVMGTVTVTAK